MKVYVITEEEYYPESPDFRIMGVVSSIDSAEKFVEKLNQSVKAYNKSQNLYDVSYEYDEFELDDLSKINEFIKFNLDGRNWQD